MKRLDLFCFLWILPAAIGAQSLNVKPDTSATGIGTEMGLTVNRIAPQWRVSPDSSWILLDSTGTAVGAETRLRLMALDSGQLPLTVYALSESGETLALGQTTLGVYLPPPRPEVELEDIHEPLDPGRNWGVLVLGILLVLIAGAFLLYAIRKNLLKARKPALSQTLIVVDPHQEALDALNRMRDERAWERMSPEAFYTLTTDVYRAYLKRALGVDALERTNSELEGLLDLSAWNIAQHGVLRALAERADLAKYAEDRVRHNDPQDLDRIEQLLQWHEEDRLKAFHSEAEPAEKNR